MSRVQTALLELQSFVERIDLLDLIRGHHFDRGNLVGCTETIEEMKHREAAIKTKCQTICKQPTRQDEQQEQDHELLEQSASSDR